MGIKGEDKRRANGKAARAHTRQQAAGQATGTQQETHGSHGTRTIGRSGRDQREQTEKKDMIYLRERGEKNAA